jgi:hypothetical protein
MVHDYVVRKRPRARDERRRFKSFRSLERAVETAALALDPEDRKRAAHHRRRTTAQLERGKSALIAILPELRRCKSFDQLHNGILKATKPIKGLGELYAYDSAHFIGARLSLSPKRVYIHAGTRKAARALGFSGGIPYLMPSQLPAELQILKPYEMEDFLCMYKDAFRKRRRRS